MSELSTNPIQVPRTLSELKASLSQLRSRGGSIGLVPTMGALHEGHLSLVDAAKNACDRVVVTIFVNPTQFSPDEDLERYPRMLDDDLEKLAARGVDLVFAPRSQQIYPQDFSTYVDPPEVAKKLEGESRPTHFRGVATVVLKLFNLTRADAAFFGQKDYQQSCVIRQMVRDLNVPVRIHVCPIIRDPDGLALSSRNVYLDQSQRKVALSLHRSLQEAVERIKGGERDARTISLEMTQSMIEAGVDRVEYAVVAHPDTLESVETIDGPVVLLVAAVVGKTRLIDNWIVGPGSDTSDR